MENAIGSTMANASATEPTGEPCDDNLPMMSGIEDLLTQILYSIVCVVGILGNTLVIYVVLRFPKMQTFTNIFILNLAIADECFLIGIPFLVTTISHKNWIFGTFICKAYMITTSINQFTSSIFLLIMSADRYIAVCHPVYSMTLRTPLISRIVSVVAWLTSILFMIPVFLYAGADNINGKLSCNIYWPNEQHHGQTTFIIYTFILGFTVPLLFIFICYFLVIKKLKTLGPKRSRPDENGPYLGAKKNTLARADGAEIRSEQTMAKPGIRAREKKRPHQKVGRLVLTVITVYVLCCLPYWLTQLALIHTEPNRCVNVNVAVFLFAGFLYYANSAVNPILYAFLSENFKKSFAKACTCVAGKDINTALHNENSVVCQRGKLNKTGQPARNQLPGKTRSNQNFEEGECGLLLSNEQSANTTITMTPRSNTTIGTITMETSEHQLKDRPGKDNRPDNGTHLTLLTHV